MIWWGVAYDGVNKLLFCEKGVKASAKVYQSYVLEKVGFIRFFFNITLFANKPWTFQQDSAPVHNTKPTQMAEKQHSRVHFYRSGSSDVNPLEYKLWSTLEGMAWSTRHPNIVSKAWSCPSRGQFPRVWKANGGHFK